VALVLRIILAIQVFATVIALAGSALTTLASQSWVWATAVQDDNMAAAYAVVILVLSIGSTIAVLALLPVRDEQQA
jgi:multiple sugar transport system permease protein